jgi:sugar phosphate isomerase/epimerase
MKVGVVVESFRLGLKGGVEKSAELGLDGIQVYGCGGELDARTITDSARDEIQRFIESRGLEISALVGEVGGFNHADKNEERVEITKSVISLARKMGVSVVSGHWGFIPNAAGHPLWKTVMECVSEIAEHAAKEEIYFAAETGMEKAVALRRFIEAVRSDWVRVNYDPANLVMVAGDDPVEGVKTLGDLIVHTHAKDGVKLGDWTPAEVFLGDRKDDPAELMREMPLGRGGVDFPAWIGALRDAGYDGFLTIEREAGDDPVRDIAEAAEYLRELI